MCSVTHIVVHKRSVCVWCATDVSTRRRANRVSLHILVANRITLHILVNASRTAKHRQSQVNPTARW
jgi:Flp pilus assembly protein protease CpaA